MWTCREPESNRHSPCGEQDFKSCASTSFATPAMVNGLFTTAASSPHPVVIVEAPGGLEPPHKGFADLSLTTWVRRHQNLQEILTPDGSEAPLMYSESRKKDPTDGIREI